jgi:hypothetical protein
MSLAFQIISTLMFTRATADKLETATNVLDELYEMKRTKRMPFLAIRRAIKMQESIIKDLKK